MDVLFGEKTLPFFSADARGWDGAILALKEQPVPAGGGFSPVLVPPRAGHSSAGPGQADVHPTHLLGASWRLGRTLAAAGGAFLTPGICSYQQIQTPSVCCCLGCVSWKAGVA